MFVVIIEDVCCVLFDNDERNVFTMGGGGKGEQDILARVQSLEERLWCLCLCWRLSRSVFVFVLAFILHLICELLHTSINVCIDICSLTVDGVAGDGVGVDGVLGNAGGGNYVNVEIHKGW